MRLPGPMSDALDRVQNRWHDLRAVLAGFCNHGPTDTIDGEGSGTRGYRHWRCALPRHHVGLHRSRNYVWDDSGSTNYVPVVAGKPMPEQPWGRNATPTMGQARMNRQWRQRQSEKRRAARQRGVQ